MLTAVGSKALRLRVQVALINADATGIVFPLCFGYGGIRSMDRRYWRVTLIAVLTGLETLALLKLYNIFAGNMCMQTVWL